MVRSLRWLLVPIVVLSSFTPAQVQAWTGGQAVFQYTGRPQRWVVPAGLTSVHVDVQGAPGSWFGAKGGRVEADLAVKPGQTYLIYVGGQSFSEEGGWNGGGDAGARCSDIGMGGGGASDIRFGGSSLRHRIAVAGGGGGGGPWTGGAGGDTTGDDGRDGSPFESDDFGGGGGGGAPDAGGAGGVPGAGSAGTGGSLSRGGAGGAGDGRDATCGSGGGGGYHGGGGGGGGEGALGGGGGGGSSYVSPAFTNVLHTAAYSHGLDGIVVIGWGENEAPGAPRLATPRRGQHVPSDDQYFSIIGTDPERDNYVAEAEVADLVTGLVVTTFSLDSGELHGERSGRDVYGGPAPKLPDGHYTWRARAKDVNRYGGRWGPWSPSSYFVVGRGSPVCNATAVIPDC